MGPFRQSDAVLTVAQDNTRHAIEVTASNEIAEAITGYGTEELRGKKLQDIVSPKVAEMIEDYVEFEAGANDVGDVLRKVRDFHLQNRDGKAIPFKLRIVRHNSLEHDEFMLIMQNVDDQRETEAFLAVLRANFEGHASLNADTGLADRESFLKGVELTGLQLDKITNGVCVAVVEIDAYEVLLAKYGINACNLVLQDVAKLCSQNLRSNDIVAQFDQNRLALLLIGASKEPAQMVLNRLRWLIASNQTRIASGAEVQTTVSILFHEIKIQEESQTLVDRFENTFANKPADSTNLVAYI